MKKLLFLFAIFHFTLFAQKHFIEGYVYERSTYKPLAGANIVIKAIVDSSVYGIASDANGRFRVENIAGGNYSITVSYVGYKSFHDTLFVHNSIDMEDIYLSPSEVNIGDVEIIARAIPVIINEDTTEYNADAFTTHKNASAEDLLSKMPGIIIDDGSMQAQGEDVTKVIVDGREFFSNDPNAVLKNIPAEMVAKFQVYDEKNEQAEFSGYEDGNTTKTINIVTREEFHNGLFGKLSAGYGSDKRYLGGGNLNLFDGDKRITLLGQLNNINEQNFSSEDLLGVMSQDNNRRGGSSQSGGRGMPGNGGPPPGGDLPRGDGPSIGNGLIASQDGLAETKFGGVNYNDRWADKINIGGNYFYNITDNNTEAYLDRDYLLTSTNQNYIEQSISNSKNINHRMNLRFNYEIDSLNSILFHPNMTIQDNRSLNNSTGTTSTNSGLLNSSISTANTDLSAVNASSSLLFRHRFNTNRRTISMNFTGGYNNNKGTRQQYSEINYYNSETESDTVDQITNIDNDGYNASLNLVYTEPLGSRSMLILNSYYSYSSDENDQKVFDWTENNSLDSTMSNIFSKVSKAQRYSIGYNYFLRRIQFSADLSYGISILEGNQIFPYNLQIKKKFHSLLPSLMLNYKMSSNSKLRVSYQTKNDVPSIKKLQNVLDNSNTLQLSVGNPDLEQTYRHSLMLSYASVKTSESSSFFVNLSATYVDNYIADHTIVAETDTTVFEGIELNQGVQITKPVNLSGYTSIRSFMTYGFPIDFIKSNLNLNANFGYTKTPGIANYVKNLSHSLSYELGFVLSSTISEDFDFTLSSRSGYNVVNNSSKQENDESYFNQKTRLKFYWDIWQGIVLQAELQHSYEGGLSEDYDPDSYTLNLSIGKKLFSNERGEIRLSVYDLLNESSNIRRNITDNYIEDRSTNIVGRFFLASFIYDLRIFY